MELYHVRYILLIVILVLVGMSVSGGITGMATRSVTLEPDMEEAKADMNNKQSNSAMCSSIGTGCQWDPVETVCVCP